MSQSDDTHPNRGRPVLKRIDPHWEAGHIIGADAPSPISPEHLLALAAQGRLWLFCDEHDGSGQKAADAASHEYGGGIYKVFPSGSWPGGYLRD